MSPDEYQQFWRTVQSTVEKDVVRTDRTHPYFMGDDNPNIEILQLVVFTLVHANSTNQKFKAYEKVKHFPKVDAVFEYPTPHRATK